MCIKCLSVLSPLTFAVVVDVVTKDARKMTFCTLMSENMEDLWMRLHLWVSQKYIFDFILVKF